MPAVTPLTLTHPNLILEWNQNLNTSTPESYSKGSTHKAWWNCPKGHSYEANISARVRGTGCPYCSGRKAITGVNDAATLHPQLLSEWHPDNNKSLNTFRPGSQEKGLWKCFQGHQWEAKIRDRVNGSGCHVCAGKAIHVGYNDLTTTHPLVAALWDYEKNTLTPKELTGKSEKKVFFKCLKGHHWEASPSRQTQVSSGCSYCAGRKAIAGDNDLSSLYPQLSSEWHPEKNGSLLPSQVTGTMDKKVWWLGGCGHEWEASLHARVGQGQNCPYCAGRKALKGFNDLVTKHPELVEEWDIELNGNLKPEMFTRGSNHRAYWKCAKEHSWIATINYRTCSGRGLGCPVCSSLENISAAEKEIVSFLKINSIEVKQSNRTILDGKELDILLPEFNIAIEFNGLYWHSEAKGKGKYYHYNKWSKAKEKGITLFHIWEDEWMSNQDLIKKLIMEKIKPSQVVNSKLEIVNISEMETKVFLNKNTLNEWDEGTHYFGVKNRESIIAVMILLQKDNEIEIVNYACIYEQKEVFNQLITFVEQTMKPRRIFASSSNGYLSNDPYLEDGFILQNMIEPVYRYIIGRKRVQTEHHNLQSRQPHPVSLLKEIRAKDKLTEPNPINRIWDAGKIRWVKQCKSTSTT